MKNFAVINIVPFIAPYPAAVGNRSRKLGKRGNWMWQRIEDPDHPRGYRQLRSNAEMRELLNRNVVEQGRECALCHLKFTNYNDIVPDHINPKGMGGSWRDDHPDNIQAVHWMCNGEKGSSRG